MNAVRRFFAGGTMFTQQIDVQEYLEQGYLTAAAIFSPDQLDELRRASDRYFRRTCRAF
jgi:hypothetical protein